tara:strand:+ start:489 stop:914 length:426 start_codon:yes stop_codon:yes gene_type:complete
MVTRNNTSIDLKILEMRKNNCGLFTIHKWLNQWGDFQILDEIVVLGHILNIVDKNNLAVSRSEVLYTFNKFYSKEYHGDKRSYLNWLYREFSIKEKTRVRTSQVRRKHISSSISDTKTPSLLHDLKINSRELGNTASNRGK